MTRKRTLLVVALVLAAAVPAVSGGALAQSSSDEGSFFDPLVSDSGGPGWFSSLWLSAQSEIAQRWASYTTDPGNATKYADGTMQTFNANNKSIAAYVNERLTVDTDHDVFAVHFQDRSGNNVTRYVVSTVANESYTDSRMLTPSEFDATGRSTDYAITMDWYVSSHANEELETFVTEYASTGENLSTTYKVEMLAKYGGGISSGLWNGGAS